MATIAALIAGRRERAQVQAAVQGRADVVYCDTGAAVADAATNNRAAAIVALWDAHGRSQVPAILSLRKRLPALPIYVCCEVGRVDVQEIARAGSAGIKSTILHGPEEAWIALEDMPEATERDRVAHGVLHTTDRIIPIPAKRLFRFALAHVRPRPTVEAAAAVFGVPRSTLFAQFAAARLPAPGELISWARLLFAGFVLEAWGRSVDWTALRAGLESGAALRALLKRKTGLRPQELLACGGYFHLMQRFERALWTPPPDHETPSPSRLQNSVTADSRVPVIDTSISNTRGNVASKDANTA